MDADNSAQQPPTGRESLRRMTRISTRMTNFPHSKRSIPYKRFRNISAVYRFRSMDNRYI
jgi:hypothetical protein